MKDATGRFVILFLIASIAGCSPDRALGPDDDPSLATVGGSSFGLTATAFSYNQIDVTWIDASNSESGYELWRSTTGATGTFTLQVTLGFDVTSFSDLSVAAVTEYCYRVRSFRRTVRKTSYSAFSSTSCATTPARPAPKAPFGLNARPANDLPQVVVLVWTDVGYDGEGFRVERASNGEGPWERLPVVISLNTPYYLDQGRAVEQQWCYRVFAFRGQLESVPSNVDCTYIPASPTGLTATVVGAAAVDLAWTDNSAHEEGYQIERYTPWGGYAVIASLGANTTMFRDASVASDLPYTYRVFVTREGTRQGYSNGVSVIIVSTPPNAPSDVQAVPNGSTTITINWADNSTNESGFRLERSENGGASWGTVATPQWQGFVDDAGLGTEREVCYRVFALNSLGDSPPSNIDCTTPPAAPTNLVATTASGPSIDLTWTDNSNVEDGYVIEQWFDDCAGGYVYCYQYYAEIARLGPNATSISGLGPGLYVVRAVKDQGYSDYSNEVSAP